MVLTITWWLKILHVAGKFLNPLIFNISFFTLVILVCPRFALAATKFIMFFSLTNPFYITEKKEVIMVSKNILMSLVIGLVVGATGSYGVLTLRYGGTPSQIVTLQAQVASLKSEVDKIPGLQEQVSTLTSQVNSLTAEKTSLQNQVNSLTGEKTALQNQISGKDSQISALQSQISEMQSEIESLRDQIRDFLPDA